MKKLLLLVTFLICTYSIGYSQCTPSVSLKGDKNNVCIGEQITFTATPVNGGSTPIYVWSSSVYGVLSETTDTYVFTAKIQYEVISVKMTSSLGCASPSSATESINVSYYFNAGLIGNYQTICYNTIPSTISVASINTATMPIYSWEVSQTGTDGSFTLLQGETDPTYTPKLALTQDLYIRRLLVDQSAQAPCNSGYSNIVKITVTPTFFPGSISSDQTVCSNSLPKDLFELIPSNAVMNKYDWEESTDGITYNLMPVNSNTSYYNSFYKPYTSDIYIRRIITDITRPSSCNTAISNSIKITIQPTIVPGVITGDESICNEQTTPATTISESIAPTGSLGIYYYQWQSNAVGFFYNIAGATNNSYDPGYLSTTTSFRLVYGPCANATSNVITKTVKSNVPTAVSINHPAQLCSGVTTAFNATVINGGSSPSFQWYLDNTPIGTNSASYNYTPLSGDNGKYITVQVIPAESCYLRATSSAALLNIGLTSPTVSISTLNNPICDGSLSTFIVTSTGSGPIVSYKWYFNSTAVSNSNFFTLANLTDGDEIYVEMTSSLNSACLIGTNPFVSNKIIMTVKPIPNPQINEGDQTICAGSNSFTFNTSPGSGTNFQWVFNGVPISGATAYKYEANLTGTYSVQENNGACTNTSSPVILTIDPCGAFSSFINGPNPITPGQQNAVYSVVNQTGFSYAWNITGGTITSGQNTNSVTVDWDAPATTSAVSRISTPGYSISVIETNPDNQKKTTTIGEQPTTTSVSKSLMQSGITLFPNPTTESFNIEIPESGVAVNYEVLDLTGASVAQGNFISTSTAEKITTNFGAGMYQVVLRYNDVVTCGRLSKVQ